MRRKVRIRIFIFDISFLGFVTGNLDMVEKTQMVPSVIQYDKPRLKQFRVEGCLSYCVFDPASREAIVIDPHLALMDEYRAYLSENRLKLRFIVDLSTHVDHFSASHLLRTEHSCEIAMSARSACERATMKLASGHRLAYGKFSLETIDAQGQAPDSICLLGTGMLFTGDVLWIGGSGPLAVTGSDAALMWRVLHETLGGLPPDTIVFPGHDHNDLHFSTLGTERKKNPHLSIGSSEGFASLKKSEKARFLESEIRMRLEFNRSASPMQPVSAEERSLYSSTYGSTGSVEVDRTGSISVEKYLHKLEQKPLGSEFIDIREPDEYEEGHMPGARSIPTAEVPLHLGELAGSSRIYISCLSGRRSGRIARTLAYIGFRDVVNVSGGFKAWVAAGLPTEKSSSSD
jgi:rhodanese-related sulfurtransferase/glyoxylase-like metal-dependent hydrolase (beta-lactamase superfamily II)